ncbi:MAG: sigma-70 family RNA polymerase sigma factor [Acidimicrobiales bacterium]
MSGGAGVSGGSDAGHPGGASRSLDAAAEVFEAERPRLVGLAYRLLGSLTDAEDVVQEAWLRWAAVDRSGIERPAAWLTTVVSRVGLDRLRAARERASYVGPWLPEPLVEPLDRAADDPPATLVPPGSVDPAEQAALADSLTTAFLVLLERLAPEERLVVLLVDVFGEPFRVAAEVTGRSEAAARQMAVRSRRKLRAAAPVADPSPGEPPPHRPSTGRRPPPSDRVGPTRRRCAWRPRCSAPSPSVMSTGRWPCWRPTSCSSATAAPTTTPPGAR